ncbi:MAG TPA: tetratricopeptide repeat protein [Gammaproteobacteria bacterium]
MSLINEMLKDLEARGGTDKVAGDVRSTAHPAPRSANRGLLYALGALTLALAAAVAWLLLDDSQELTAAATTPLPAAVATVEEPANVPPAPRATTAVEMKTETGDAPVSPAPVEETVEDSTPAVETPAATSKTAPIVADPRPAPTDTAETLIVRRHEPTPAQKAARASREGFAALRRQDWSTAARLLGELVTLEPANDDAREGLVIALANQGRLAEADGVLLDGLAVGVEPARFAKLRARLLASQNRLDDALQSLAVTVPEVAADPEFHALRGALAQQAGDYSLALNAYRGLVAFAPGNGTWQAGLAMALDQVGEPAQALDAYRHAYAAGGLEPALLEHVRKRLDALSETEDANGRMQERSAR